MPNGGQLCISTQVVRFDAEACQESPFEVSPGSFLQVSVFDSGSGISQHVLPHIFEPFFTTKEPGEGTGMGLAAVYGAVVEHRGALTVQSQVESGTEFRVYLPLIESVSVSTDIAQSAPAGRGLVLLVDDEPLVLSTASKLLRSIGYDVVTARATQGRCRPAATANDACVERTDRASRLRRVHVVATNGVLTACPALPVSTHATSVV